MNQDIQMHVATRIRPYGGAEQRDVIGVYNGQEAWVFTERSPNQWICSKSPDLTGGLNQVSNLLTLGVSCIQKIYQIARS